MEALLVDALKGALTASPFVALLFFLWWTERTERKEAQTAATTAQKEAVERYAKMLEKAISSDYESANAMNKMTTVFEATARLMGAQR